MKLTGLILGVLGALLLGAGGFVFLREQLFLQRAEQAVAVVTDNRQYTYTTNDYGVQHYYCSEFEFKTKAGQTVSFRESDGGDPSCAELDRPPDYQAGEHVPVHYDPHDPANTVQIPKSVKQSFAGVVILLVSGTLLLLAGLAVAWSALIRSRRAAAAHATQHLR